MKVQFSCKGSNRVGYTCYNKQGEVYGGSSSFRSKLELDIPDDITAVIVRVLDHSNTMTSTHVWENDKWKTVEETDKLVERLARPRKPLPPVRNLPPVKFEDVIKLDAPVHLEFTPHKLDG